MVRAFTLVSVALPLALVASPAAAQVSDEIIVNILRNCAQIDDPTARLACYDNNIRAAGAGPRNSVPGAMAAPDGGRGTPMDSGRATGFGSEDIRTPERFASAPGSVADEVRARVADISERQRGVYLVTLEGGAQWLFTESVPCAYRPPRAGDTIEIDRAALGSFLMTFDSQRSVRVERVR